MALTYPQWFAATAIAVLYSAPLYAEGDAPEVQQQGDFYYVTGGIGDDETAALQAVQSQYNLRVMNADKAGHFSGDTRIVISDLRHNALIDATAGPLFYANLPNGRYRVEGFSNQQHKEQVVTIAKGKPARVHFVWPQEDVAY